MKKLTFSLLFVFIIFSVTKAQVSINADGASANPKAMLDIQSNSKGLLIPRMTTNERINLFNFSSDTEIGMLVFDTDVKFFFVYMGNSISKKLASGAISLLEDEDGDTKIEVERTADDDTIRFSTAGSDRFTMSKGLLEVLNTNSIFIGEKAGNGLTNFYNTAIGYKSMSSNIGGTWNTALGYHTLNENTSGKSNTAIGHGSLNVNKIGNGNTSIGNNAMSYNTSGSDNTAVGYKALYYNIKGIYNTAVGDSALYKNSTGDLNVAIGKNALVNFIGDKNNNIAIGAFAAENLTDGYNNIIIGTGLHAPNPTGSRQMYLGGAIYGDLSNGNIGIGTTSPAARLHVSDVNCKAIIESTTGNAELHIKTLTNFNSSIAFYNNNLAKALIEYDHFDKYLRIWSGGDYVFKDGNLGIGTSTPEGKLHLFAKANVSSIIESGNGVASLEIRSGSGKNATVALYSGGAIGAYAGYNVAKDAYYIYKGGNIFFNNGGIYPGSDKGGDLGTTAFPWDDIYYDDLHNLGAAAFTDRSVTDEILLFPPIAKKEGDFDYMTGKGLEELDPNFLPDALQEDYSILTDEMTTYNYKANYEQQVQIEELKELVEQLVSENKSLQKKVKRIEKRVRSKK